MLINVFYKNKNLKHFIKFYFAHRHSLLVFYD